MNMSTIVTKKLAEMFAKLAEVYAPSKANKEIAEEVKNIRIKDMERLSSNAKHMTFTIEDLDRILEMKLPKILKKLIPNLTKTMYLDCTHEAKMAELLVSTNTKAHALINKYNQLENNNDKGKKLVAEFDKVKPLSGPWEKVVEKPSKKGSYYVKVIGRPTLPDRKEMESFLNKFKPKSIKKHKKTNNLLFVCLADEKSYENILKEDGRTFGEITLEITPSLTKKETEKDSPIDAGQEDNATAVDKIITSDLDEQIDDLLSAIKDSEDTDNQTDNDVIIIGETSRSNMYDMNEVIVIDESDSNNPDVNDDAENIVKTKEIEKSGEEENKTDQKEKSVEPEHPVDENATETIAVDTNDVGNIEQQNDVPMQVESVADKGDSLITKDNTDDGVQNNEVIPEINETVAETLATCDVEMKSAEDSTNEVNEDNVGTKKSGDDVPKPNEKVTEVTETHTDVEMKIAEVDTNKTDSVVAETNCGETPKTAEDIGSKPAEKTLEVDASDAKVTESPPKMAASNSADIVSETNEKASQDTSQDKNAEVVSQTAEKAVEDSQKKNEEVSKTDVQAAEKNDAVPKTTEEAAESQVESKVPEDSSKEEAEEKKDVVTALKSGKESGRATPTRSSSRLANVTPMTIRTRRASKLAQNEE